jgi:hypothetical protein
MLATGLSPREPLCLPWRENCRCSGCVPAVCLGAGVKGSKVITWGSLSSDQFTGPCGSVKRMVQALLLSNTEMHLHAPHSSLL